MEKLTECYHENDARLMVAGIVEHFTNQACRLSDVLVDDCARDDFQEVCIELRSNGTSQKRLSCTGRAVQQATFWWSDSDSQEQLWIEQWKFNDFTQLADLLRKAADGRVGDIAGILVRHVIDERINLARQISHDGKCSHIQRDTSARLQLRLVQLSAATNNISRAICGFHNNCNNKDIRFLFSVISILTFVLGELLQNFTDDLSNALQCLQVILRFVELLGQLLESFANCKEIGTLRSEAPRTFKTCFLSVATRLPCAPATSCGSPGAPFHALDQLQ